MSVIIESNVADRITTGIGQCVMFSSVVFLFYVAWRVSALLRSLGIYRHTLLCVYMSDFFVVVQFFG